MIVVLAIVLIHRGDVTAVCCNIYFLSNMKAKEELSEKTSNIPAHQYKCRGEPSNDFFSTHSTIQKKC